MLFVARMRLGALSAALLAVGLVAPRPAHGAETPTYLQMANMTALAATPDGRRSNIPVTVFVQVDNIEVARELCRRVPVVRTAVLDATSQRPIPYAKGQIDPTANADFVSDRINAALGGKIVARIAFVHGTPKDLPSTATDLAEAGDVTTKEKTVKSGQAGQMAPCRRISAPPANLKWVDAKAERRPAQGLARPEPPLRQNRPPAPPTPEFKGHPQFNPPAPNTGPKPRSEAPPATPPPIAIIAAPEQIQADTPPSVRDCVPLDKIWKHSRYPYAGVLYTLFRVFTIDSNGDGRADNIGFVLRAPDQPDVIFRYFDEPGRAAIDLFPSLSLKDPRSIAGICFGQFDLQSQDTTAVSRIQDRLTIDILHSEVAPALTVQATGVGFWISVLAVVVGLMGAMLTGIALARSRRAAKAARATAEDDEDDTRAGNSGERRRSERRKSSVPAQTERRATPDRRKK